MQSQIATTTTTAAAATTGTSHHHLSPVRRHSLGIGSTSGRPNKRKQSHPMRSPFPTELISEGVAAERYTMAETQNNSPPSLRRASLTSDRAFCFSFLDDYSRNQQAYIQALHGPASLPPSAAHSSSKSAPHHHVHNHQAAIDTTTSSVGGGGGASEAEDGDSPSVVATPLTASNSRKRSRHTSTPTMTTDCPSPLPSPSRHIILCADHHITSSSTTTATTATKITTLTRTIPAATITLTKSPEGSSGIAEDDYDDNNNNNNNNNNPNDENDEFYMSFVPPTQKSTVKWTKAEPINISDKPFFSKLAPAEQHCCSVLRIAPEQYLTIKRTLIREGRSRTPGTFKKRDAQRLCRIDVNKTSKIYEWYVKIGWIPDSYAVSNSDNFQGSSASGNSTPAK